MIYSVAFMLSLVIAPFLAHFRGWKPGGIILTAAAVYAIFGAVSFMQFQIMLSQASVAETANSNDYLVFRHGHFSINSGIAMTVIGTITWVQTRFGAMLYPALTNLFFWVLNFALIAGTSLQSVLTFVLPRPRRYIDYPEYMETFAMVSAWSSILSKSAILALSCLLVWSIIAKLSAK